jgi:outer membrane protein assembly factor BamB
MTAIRPFARRLFAPTLALVVSLYLPSDGEAADWPQYRGPNHDGISFDRLNTEWTGSVTNPLWRVLVPNCLGSLTASGGRVFTQTRRPVQGTNMEVVVALAAGSGLELWSTPVDNALYPNGGVGFDDGPRSTPVVDGGSVFVLSSYHKLWRLNAMDGAVIWRKDLPALYGGEVIPWQNAASPLIENGLIYINANCNTQTLLALRTSDGEPAWRSQDVAMTHATPVLATIHGVRQVIFATQDGLVSVDPLAGAPLWRAEYPIPYTICIGVSPVVDEDMVFATGAQVYGMESMALRVDLSDGVWTTTRLWATNNPTSHWMTPVARQGFLYGQFGIQSFDSVNAQLKCVDLRTGVVKWSVNGFGRGATVLVDDYLVSLTERGQLVLVRPNPTAYTELARFTAIPNYFGDTNKCWNGPAVSDGRLFVRSTAYVAAFDLLVPALVMDGPEFVAPDKFALSIRTANGTPLASNRFASLEVHSSPDPAQALPEWTPLASPAVLTGGIVRVGPVPTNGQPQRFFRASEPRP